MTELVLFYDDCHKIYYAKADDQKTIDQMTGYGYTTITGDFRKNLDELWAKSCPLRMIDPADLDFKQPSVPQGHSGQTILRKFKADINKYFKEVQ